MDKKSITLSEVEYWDSIYSTNEWCLSVTILSWEHDFVKKQYTIIYVQKA